MLIQTFGSQEVALRLLSVLSQRRLPQRMAISGVQGQVMELLGHRVVRSTGHIGVHMSRRCPATEVNGKGLPTAVELASIIPARAWRYIHTLVVVRWRALDGVCTELLREGDQAIRGRGCLGTQLLLVLMHLTLVEGKPGRHLLTVLF